MQAQRPRAKTFRDLLVWRKADEFVLEVYRYTESFPQREIYGLVQQMRKAAVSIPANVAEGFKRRGKADKARVMNIAEGSLASTTWLAHDLGYGGPQEGRMNLLRKSAAC
jgi:four helix bundle protein